MRNDLTELIYILDASGSMGSFTDDTIGGFNSMIEDQKTKEGYANVTTVTFNSSHTVVHNCVDIREIPAMTKVDYHPSGTTALLDTLGNVINSVGERLAETPEEERPGAVLVTIITDGYENASREFTKAKIKEMIEHQQNKYSWKFIFIGSNMDAISEATSYGISGKYAATYTSSEKGLNSVYSAVAASTSELRSCTMDSTLDALESRIEAAMSIIE